MSCPFAVQNSSQAGHSLASRIPSLLSLLQGVADLPWVQFLDRSVNPLLSQVQTAVILALNAQASCLTSFPPLLFTFTPILWRGTVPSLALLPSFVAGVINRSASLLLAPLGSVPGNVFLRQAEIENPLEDPVTVRQRELRLVE